LASQRHGAVSICPALRWGAVRREKLLHIGLGGGLALAVLVPLGAFAFVKSGIYNAGASSPHSKFTTWLTHETMVHSVKSHARDIVAPASIGAAQVRRGFCEYETHCVACHGAPAVARGRWVSGMEPAPPYLVDATRTWRPRELFWIARNGIKMTGMPAWRNAMSDGQIWDVVAWLEASRDLPPQTYVQWRSEGVCGALSGGPSPGSSAILRRAPALPTGATGG
jgi:mono/diheme cytochrome c family protein